MHRAEHLHGVSLKLQREKAFILGCRDYEDVTAKTFSLFV